jgi:cell division protein FtsL
MLTRINVILVLLLVLCALGLVTSQHRARKVFVEVERAQAHAASHEVRWNQLQVEQTELAKSARIDSRARGELGMQSAPSERTLHLSIDPATRQVSLSQPWRETPGRALQRTSTHNVPRRPQTTVRPGLPRAAPVGMRTPTAAESAAKRSPGVRSVSAAASSPAQPNVSNRMSGAMQ